MTFRRSAWVATAVAVGVLPLVACGSDRAGAVTAPSSTLSSPLATGIEPSAVSGSASRVSAAETPSNTITSLLPDTSCPTLQFKISTYLIKTDAATRYTGGTCANLQAGTKITLTATRLGSDNEQTVYASQITFVTGTTTPTPTPTPPPTNPVTPVQTEVTIAGVTGTCPDVTFTVSTYTFKVSSSTGYTGATCADLKAGVKVSIVGTKRESDSFIVVTGIGIRRTDTPTPPTTPTAPTTVGGEAIVSSLVAASSCPALTFLVGGSYTVVTSASTRWENGTCADLKVGSKVALTGTRTGEASIAATNIAFRDGAQPPEPTRPAEPVEGEGVVTSVSGSTACPTLQFFIGPYLIKADGSTQYVGGFCTDLKAGVRVHVRGAVNADRSVSAATITVHAEAPRPGPEAEGEGLVTALVSGTACPTLRFQVSEYTITVTASTQFVGGSCGSIAVGKKLGVRGTMTGEKSATASLITIKN